MSFFDDASLAFLPSGGAGKDGKAYSIKPTDGTGDFTFSRGSNLTATRVGPTGLIEKGRENLLLQSNTFNVSPWSNGLSGGSVVTGQTGYDGSSDAWLMTTQGTNGYLSQSISQSGVQTLSIYAKAGTAEYLLLRAYEDTTTFAYYHLSGSGSVTLSSGDIETNITRVGTSDWYRCSLTYTGGLTLVRVYMAGNNTTTVNIGDNIYIQDAQVEAGLAATDYIESGATTGKAGLLENEPRFDYSGGATCPSLLLEPQRVNLVTSEYFADYTNSDLTLTTNNGTSPEGVTNATLFEATGTSAKYIEYNVAGAGTYTQSYFFKKGATSGYPSLSMYGLASNDYETGVFDFDAKTFAETSGSITSFTNVSYDYKEYGNGWFRLSQTFTASKANQRARIVMFNEPTPTLGSIGQRNWTANGESFSVWGWQTEAGSYPTSYIPNHSGGIATRTADLIQKLNQSSVIGQTEGTIFFDAFFKENDKVNFSLSDSTSSNHLTIDTTGANSVFGRVVASGTTQAEISTSAGFFTNGDRLKCALAYKENDFAFYINGTQIGMDTSGSVPVCDDIRFARYNGSLSSYQGVNQVLLFDTRLSNADLETLTT